MIAVSTVKKEEEEEEEEEERKEGEGIALKNVDENVMSGRMLTMAGLFDICSHEGLEVILFYKAQHLCPLSLSLSLSQGGPLYTYTVITVDAHSDFAHIHDRMPAILDGEEAISAWLDPSVSTQEAVKSLYASPSLTWYPVSDVVNNVKNKTSECIMKIDLRL